MSTVLSLDSARVKSRSVPVVVTQDPYEQVLARRNAAWAAYEAIKIRLGVARLSGDPDLTPYIRICNEAQKEYEHAEYDLVRAREQQRAVR
jgi:hypothetical protein